MNKARRIDLALDPELLTGIDQLDLDQLRERRDLAESVENELSYYRRVLHGRMDLLAFEARRRSGEETRSLIDALPDILSSREQGSSSMGGRHMTTALPELPVTGRRHIDRVLGPDVVVKLAEFDAETLAALQEELSDVEVETSGLRRQLQIVVDRLQTEIVARYKAGLLDPETA